jgi:DNA ligase-associated metallophosphoesterase
MYTLEKWNGSFSQLFLQALIKDIVIFGGHSFTVLVERCLYWASEKVLIISDVHLGKSNHFRKSGIALSLGVELSDLGKITALIHQWKPEKVIFLGDLFHSNQNAQWDLFAEWIAQFTGIEFQLVIGNHDLLPEHIYDDIGLKSFEQINIQGICLSHEPLEDVEGYNICGHIHPGVRLVGKALQSVRIPCFLVGTYQMILPAFGSLTGLYIIDPKEDEIVFGIADSTMFRYG